MKIFSTVGGVLVAVLVICLLAVGGWLGYWWLAKSSTNHQANIDRSNNGTQLGYRKAIEDKIVEVNGIDVQLTTPGLPADTKQALANQRVALVHDICGIAVNTDPSAEPADMRNFLSIHCP